MNPSFKYELLTLTLLSCLSLVIPSPLPAEQSSSAEYLTSRSDIDAALSKIIRPNEQIALLSDFDGTLGEINPNPYLTVIKQESKDALDQLITRPNVFVAIISGRRMFNLKSKVGIENITYSGNHGMEIIFANQSEFHYPITPEMYENCTKLKTLLSTEYGMDKRGGWVEDKNISLVYNYHHVPLEDREGLINEINQIVCDYGFKPIPAHDGIEIKPPVVWTKGHAAVLILDEYFGSDWPTKDIRVLFMGDDTSDEDAMKMLKGKGTTFRITANPDLETNADFKLQSLDTATHLLDWLVDNTHH